MYSRALMQHTSSFVFSYLVPVLSTVCMAVVPVLSSEPVYAQDPPTLRVVERTSSSVTARIRTSWTTDLSGHIDPAAATDTAYARKILRSVRGFRELSEMLELSDAEKPTVQVVESDYEETELSDANAAAVSLLSGVLVGEAASIEHIGTMRGQTVGTLVARLLTFDSDRRVLRRYRSMLVRVTFSPSPRLQIDRQTAASAVQAADSRLAEGSWYKLPVTEDGVYRIDRTYIADSMGLNPDQIDPSEIGVYGNGGKPLPASNDAPRPDGLLATPSLVDGGGDGSFDSGDYVLFFANGPSGWTVSGREDEAPAWQHYRNPYTDHIYYFLRLDDPAPTRIEASTRTRDPAGEDHTTFVERRFVEEDQVNLGSDGGSGLEWLSRSFERGGGRTILSDETLPGKINDTMYLRTRVAASASNQSEIALSVNGGEAARVTIPPVYNSSTRHVARARRKAFTVTGTSEALTVRASFEQGPASARGYVDWLEWFYTRDLAAEDDYLRFHTPVNESGSFTFALDAFGAQPMVWDVTAPAEIARLSVHDTSPYRVALSTSEPRELVAFRPDSPSLQRPSSGQSVANQNLRGISGYPDAVVVTPDTFRTHAEELAELRRSQGLNVVVAPVEEIYNEFSGGTPDMRAVRDYLKFLYDRAADEPRRLRYALFFGDGHVDFRGLTNASLNNWILPYETEESLLQIATYTSDDYFGLLDDDEGEWSWEGSSDRSSERVDIGIGRLPVQTVDEAAVVVAKLKQYEQEQSMGSWRGEYTLIADDGPNGSSDDYDLHTQNMEAVADVIRQEGTDFNLNKIYAQSYPAQTTARGRRVPGARDDMLRSLEEGTLLWNYTGHGGPNALAQERLFELDDIDVLRNARKPTIGITATCSFGHWDMPDRQSGAELMVLEEGGGAIAMMTTVRIVFTSTSLQSYNVGLNRALNRALLRRDDDGRPRRLGDIMRITKNSYAGAQGNNRKFNLLGDPMMRIGMPDRPSKLVRLNDAVLEDTTVSLPALKEVNLTGEVLDYSGQRDHGFNGTATFTVFDAMRQVNLRPDQVVYLDDSSYTVRSDVVYRGRARVEDGTFSSSFVVPKDISYSDKPARISFYVQSNAVDGFGATEQLTLNGTAENPVTDPNGPNVQLFLGDTTFVSGGLTGATPELIVKLRDETGLNSAGAGVGHETLLTVDGQEQEAVDIGRYFESDVGSARRGEIRYSLSRQEPGPHTLTVKSWDVVNNATKATLDYYVAPEEDLTIRNVYNYPNPTSGPTRFIVEHNQTPGTVAEVQVRIYTLSGRPIRTLTRQEALTSGPLQVSWDGMDEDLDPVATGVYLYKVRIAVDPTNTTKKVAERIERLAILR